MQIHPKSHLSAQHKLIHAIILLAGISLLILSFLLFRENAYLGSFLPGKAEIGHNNPTGFLTLLLKEQAGWKTFLDLLVTGLASAFLTISAFELVRAFLDEQGYRLTQGDDFNRFFGDNANERSDKGIILLQSDNLNKLFASNLNAERQLLNITNASRSFKARHWVNRWDTEGAKCIRDAFRAMGLQAPSIFPADHREFRTANLPESADQIKLKEILDDAPFVIALGLGFTDQTDALVAGLPWLRIVKDSPCGDCITIWHELHSKASGICPADTQLDREYTLGENSYRYIDDNGFVSILPSPNFGDKSWSIQRWLDDASSCLDYGIIIRRTRYVSSTGNRQIHFVAAGFTERATAIAAKYLAEKWPELQRSYVKARAGEIRGNGDFLLLISGKSDLDKWKDWTKSIEISTDRIRRIPSVPGHANHDGWPPLT